MYGLGCAQGASVLFCVDTLARVGRESYSTTNERTSHITTVARVVICKLVKNKVLHTSRNLNIILPWPLTVLATSKDVIQG